MIGPWEFGAMIVGLALLLVGVTAYHLGRDRGFHEGRVVLPDNGRGRIWGEVWDAYTPAPHPYDRFTCDHGCLWARLDGNFGHGRAPISFHDGVRVTHYVNPPYMDRPREPEPTEVGQGDVR